jgi:AraC-like DNA-binding protein
VQELTGRRLDYARDLLQRGGNTITGAAFSSGFNDISHFYRLYRRRYGGPPGRDLPAGG